ncbi:hypothetical protein [Chitinophaga japonensis]|uniref:Uncharacterized protein n=1 Tax=Chitinophaga japonensis TaxID=104662 RepID=A0A562SZ59_CHIJA|nr:hypothetical protein [Chitinophaga japonensis]TWI86552.1 hypothetical protein LX66_3811 [Chitinophaga japonensis]
MMKRSIYWFLGYLLCCQAALHAQTPQVTLSAAFAEPAADGWDKLVLLSNGNTCYLHFDRSEGIQVAVYNAQRELVATEKIAGRQWDTRNLNDTEIDGVYAINGQVVVFLQQLVRYRPHLFRIVIDGSTGRLLQEEKLGELPTVLHREAYALDNLASHDFYVCNDPRSGYYAVASFAGGELQRKENPAERIQVMHFSPDHQLLSHAYYTLPGNAYTYFSYLDMAVQGREAVYLCTAGFNTKRSGDKQPQSTVFLSALRPGQDTFQHQSLDYTANFGGIYADLQYAPRSGLLQLLLSAATEATRKEPVRRLFMNYLDPATGSLLLQRPLDIVHPMEGAQPQLVSIEADGSTVLQLEQMHEFTQGKNVYNMLHTNLDNVQICRISDAGEADSGYVIPKMQVANGAFKPLYLQRKNRGAWVFRNRVPALNTTPYLSFDHIHTDHGDYTLFNDYLQHLDRGGTFEEKKPLRYLQEANIICYRYEKGQGERLFLFGKPETDKAFYCMLGASDRTPAGDGYATILVKRMGAEKKAYIAWIKF